VSPALSPLRRLSEQAFVSAMDANLENIEAALEPSPGSTFLDAGCDDGELTLRFARAAGSDRIHGIEIVPERAQMAAARGIDVSDSDLNQQLPYEDGSFDAVCSNQVIEHLADTDRFVAELHRILRPGGYAVTSTENLASWHNIFALVLGWQPFSLTNVTSKGLGLGNPLAIHRAQGWFEVETWQHLRVFAYRGLRELFEAHGFAVETVAGAGYYPLPRRLARVDPRHAAFLTVKARKPL
jgi:2-polyprenyl-3-methyl-5-hydroxy-6-metoxy-1,4-benzoquinol methylase